MEFNILLQRITPRLKKLARHLLRIQNRGFSDAEDIYQEMCVHLWQKFRNGAPLEFNDVYIIKGCEFHIRNYLRKKTDKFKSTSLEEPINDTGLSLKDTLISASSNPCICFNNILINEIKNQMLNKKEKDVFNMLLQGHTVRSIGKHIGISHVMVIKYKNKIVKKWKNECH